MSTWRYTVKILSSGQPRAYADSYTHGRITFEIDYGGGGGLKVSTFVKEDRVRNVLQGLGHGFTEFRYPADCQDPSKPTANGHFRTRLDWLKEIEPGVWEWHTTSPFTD